MIYATMCIGKKWIDKYKDTINDFAKSNIVHVLTDDVNSFDNGIIHKYNRDVFSYYEKIPFTLNLVKKYNERITYIDVDMIGKTDLNIVNTFDEVSLYTQVIYQLDEDNNVTHFFTELERKTQETLLTKIGHNGILTFYIPEALISFPKMDSIDDIINDSKILQNIIENTYHSKTKTRKRLNEYKEFGIGYTEGWGLTSICVKYDIPVKDCNWRKRILL